MQTIGAIPPPRRRRTPGLRREELAASCGVSLTWITWLEQGRDVSASPRALARLADALRLASAERAYLFELADKRDPDPSPNEDDMPAPVLALPGRMTIPPIFSTAPGRRGPGILAPPAFSSAGSTATMTAT